MTPRKAVEYAYGANVFPAAFVAVWDVESRSIPMEREYLVQNQKEEWRQKGYTVKTKTYSDFVGMCAVKRKSTLNPEERENNN